MSLHNFLIVFALALELAATFGPATRVNLVAAGLACYFAALLL